MEPNELHLVQTAVTAIRQLMEVSQLSLPQAIHKVEDQIVNEAMDFYGGNKTKAAMQLRINRTTLHMKSKKGHQRAQEETCVKSL